jgi:hypothetical protein
MYKKSAKTDKAKNPRDTGSSIATQLSPIVKIELKINKNKDFFYLGTGIVVGPGDPLDPPALYCDFCDSRSDRKMALVRALLTGSPPPPVSSIS